MFRDPGYIPSPAIVVLYLQHGHLTDAEATVLLEHPPELAEIYSDYFWTFQFFIGLFVRHLVIACSPSLRGDFDELGFHLAMISLTIPYLIWRRRYARWQTRKRECWLKAENRRTK